MKNISISVLILILIQSCGTNNGASRTSSKAVLESIKSQRRAEMIERCRVTGPNLDECSARIESNDQR